MGIGIGIAAASIAAVVLLVFAITLVFRGRRSTRNATIGPDGFQEATVTVQGRYMPDKIRLAKGIPTRLRFQRNEDDPCSERVLFAGFDLERRLPSFQETVIEFTPESSGSFLFTCHMGMYRGKLVVQ